MHLMLIEYNIVARMYVVIQCVVAAARLTLTTA
jgi:hypothetical protein